MKISIVTCALNSSSTINKSIKSVQKQTYKNIEHLIIDGGSTDKTLSLCSECTIINNPKVEPSYAKFLGLTNASGEYILFIEITFGIQKW